MNSFNDAFAALIGNEGGYSNNPADPGGETMYGITKRVAVANGYTGDMKSLPLATAQQIAKSMYWNPCRCDSLNIDVAFQVFDAAYNSGITRASMWLQQAAGVATDGIVGQQTINAANAKPWQTIVFSFLSIRLKFYATLPTWPTFGKGWSNRVANNLSIASKG